MRILVCGGRDFNDEGLMWFHLDHYVPLGSTIINGRGRGADRMSTRYAQQNMMSWKEYPADWDTYGKAAGPIRNQQMLDTGIDLVIAFPGGTGTADMIKRAKKAGVEVKEIT